MYFKQKYFIIITLFILLNQLFPVLLKASQSVTATKPTSGTPTEASFTISTAQEIKWTAVYRGSAGEGNDFYLHTDPSNLREILLTSDVEANSDGTHFLQEGTYHISINSYNMGPGSYTIYYNRSASMLVSPENYDFDEILEGQTSSYFSFTIERTGDEHDFPIQINNISSSDNTHFELSNTPIGQSIPPDKTFRVRFLAGSTPGEHAADITVSGTSTVPVEDQQVTVRGITIQQIGELDVVSNFDLGSADWMINESVDNNLRINNIGNAAMDVTVSMTNNAGGVFSLPNGGSVGQINGGGNKSILIRGTPTAEGDYSGQINVFADYRSGNGSSNQPVNIECTGHHPIGELMVPSEFNVGEADWMLPPPDNSVENNLTIRNVGDDDMTITANITDDGGGVFTLPSGGNVGNINANSNGFLTIKATVDTETDYTGRLNIFADYGDGMTENEAVTLNATGHHPAPMLALANTDMDYYEVETGYKFRQALEIENTGDAPLEFDIRLQDVNDPDIGDFVLDLGRKTISHIVPNNKVLFEMAFQPTTNGNKEITLIIDNTNELTPTTHEVHLQGVGTDPVPMSTMLVVDRSGSMDGQAGERRKIEAAKDAGILYTELLREPWDWLGITSYNNVSSTPTSLGPISTNINDAQSLLNDINGRLLPTGSTCIGCAMESAAQEFDDSPEENTQAMIVLTDGKENVHPYIAEVKQGIKTAYQNLTIYCVGIGDPIETGSSGIEGVESSKLQEIADEFDGIFRVIQELSGEHKYDLEAFYFKVFSRIRGHQIVVDPTYWMTPSNQIIEIASVNIAECDREADFFIISEKYDYLVQLQDPSGQIIDPASTIGGVGVHIKEWGSARLIRIKFPPRSESDSYCGIWKLLLQPLQTTKSLALSDNGGMVQMRDWFRVSFLASVGSDYRMKASVAEGRVSVNQPIHLAAELTEAWWPAPNGAVSVVITKPDGSMIQRELFDDGLHFDGNDIDGKFGLDFNETNQKGYYEFLFKGVGITERGETVTREELHGKYVVAREIPPLKPLYAGFHVGSTYPTGDLNSWTDANVHFHINSTFSFNEQWQLLGMVGFNQFTAEWNPGVKHPYWVNLSLNIKRLMNAPSGSGLLLYLQAGPGYYIPKTGTAKFGFNVGVGSQLPLASLSAIEAGMDYHYILTDKSTRFIVLHLGFLFK